MKTYQLKGRKDDNGQIVGYTDGNPYAQKKFMEYAKEVLFKNNNESAVMAEIKKDYHFVEKVRLDYRNPAAHKNRLSVITAKNCME